MNTRQVTFTFHGTMRKLMALLYAGRNIKGNFYRGVKK